MRIFRCHRSRKSAFTLVEMLVVIAIIGILAALILVALSGAKLRALRMQCLNNVRQLGVIGLMYVNDNGRHPSYNDPNYPGGGAWMGSFDITVQDKGINMCPSAPLREPVPKSGNGQGTADKAWVRWTSDGQTKFFGSYGFNTWLYAPSNNKLSFNGEANVQQPSLTPVFADENWVDGNPSENEGPFHDLYNGSPLSNWGDNMGRFTIARHGGAAASSAPRDITSSANLPGAINIGFADNHSELVPLPKLWSLSWHLDWQIPATIPNVSR